MWLSWAALCPHYAPRVQCLSAVAVRDVLWCHWWLYLSHDSRQNCHVKVRRVLPVRWMCCGRRTGEEAGRDGEDGGKLQEPDGTHAAAAESVLQPVTGSPRWTLRQ